MTQNFDLNKMGLAPMTGEEMQEIDGGKFPWYEIGAIAFGIAAIVCTFLSSSYTFLALASGSDLWLASAATPPLVKAQSTRGVSNPSSVSLSTPPMQ